MDFGDVAGMGPAAGFVLIMGWYGLLETVKRLVGVSRHGYVNGALHVVLL